MGKNGFFMVLNIVFHSVDHGLPWKNHGFSLVLTMRVSIEKPWAPWHSFRIPICFHGIDHEFPIVLIMGNHSIYSNVPWIPHGIDHGLKFPRGSMGKTIYGFSMVLLCVCHGIQFNSCLFFSLIATILRYYNNFIL